MQLIHHQSIKRHSPSLLGGPNQTDKQNPHGEQVGELLMQLLTRQQILKNAKVPPKGKQKPTHVVWSVQPSWAATFYLSEFRRSSLTRPTARNSVREFLFFTVTYEPPLIFAAAPRRTREPALDHTNRCRQRRGSALVPCPTSQAIRA